MNTPFNRNFQRAVEKNAFKVYFLKNSNTTTTTSATTEDLFCISLVNK